MGFHLTATYGKKIRERNITPAPTRQASALITPALATITLCITAIKLLAKGAKYQPLTYRAVLSC